jgi:signal peptidase I
MTYPVNPINTEAPRARPGSSSSSQDAKRNIVEIVVIVVVAVIVAIFVRLFLLQLFYIPSPSMDPYLKVNDKIFVNKLAYKFHDIKRGDVIVFDAPEGVKTEKVKDLIKRVVGLPGDTVEGRCPNGETKCVVQIYVNGKRLKEPYLVPGIVYGTFTPIQVPANSVFVMGDNRDDSEDGRFFGPTPKKTIVGRAFFRIWPASGFGFLG